MVFHENTLVHSTTREREQRSSKKAVVVRLQEFIHTPILLQRNLLLRTTVKIKLTKKVD